MKEPRWSIRQIIFDTIILTAVGVPTPIIKITNTIHKRGFFCNDETIMYPVKESAIHNNIFHPLVCFISVTTIVVLEFFHHINTEEKIVLWRYKVPRWLYNAYQILVSFFFGLLTVIFIGTVIKGFIGRLRPHFFAACAPNITCTLPENLNVYHTLYECTNRDFSINSRLSFPSGHTSFATYCALFLAIYVHKRMKWRVSTLINTATEVLCMVLPIYVGVSCISDYKHHPGDVLGGAVIGGAAAAIIGVNLYGGEKLVQDTKRKQLLNLNYARV